MAWVTFSMQFSTLWRTTTFRLTAFYGLIFAVGLVALLGLVYAQSAVYLSRRADRILNVEADALAASPRDGLRARIAEELVLSGDKTNIIGLFAPTGGRIAGNLMKQPADLRPGGPPVDVPPTSTFPAPAHVIARRLGSGEILVIGRDFAQLGQIRGIIAAALIWSGLAILLAGLASGVALSLTPLRRLRDLQAAGRAIAGGDLKRRMPTSARRDELDMLAATVNYMMDEVERLMSEIKGSTETIAHDLLTPLTRASTKLHRLQKIAESDPDELVRISVEVDEVLDRFRAILRISELEARTRRAGYSPVDLADLVAPVIDLYQPLAEAGGVWLSGSAEPGTIIEADPKLLIEALSNLISNAVKFTSSGGTVRVRLGDDPAYPRIIVEDNGPGIPVAEREAVLQRFYRSERTRLTPGSGLGLSVVAAIVKLHGFRLTLEDAEPGVRAIMDCRVMLGNY